MTEAKIGTQTGGAIATIKEAQSKGYSVSWTNWGMDSLSDQNAHDNLEITIKDQSGAVVEQFTNWINIRQCVMSKAPVYGYTNAGCVEECRDYHELNRLLGRNMREGAPIDSNPFGYHGSYPWLFYTGSELDKHQKEETKKHRQELNDYTRQRQGYAKLSKRFTDADRGLIYDELAEHDAEVKAGKRGGWKTWRINLITKGLRISEIAMRHYIKEYIKYSTSDDPRQQFIKNARS